MNNPFKIKVGVLGCLLAAAGGCGRSNHAPATTSASPVPSAAAPTPTSNVLHGSAQVTLRPQVQVMEMNDALQALKGQSSDGNGFIFDAKYSKAAALKAGDVLLIKNLLARKVLASDATPDGIVVLTQAASLVDVVKDGHIAMDAAMHFKAGSKTAGAKTAGAVHPAHPLLQFWRALLPGTVAMAQDSGWSNNTRNPSLPTPTPGVGNNGQTGPSLGTQINNALSNPYLKPFKGTLQDWDIDWDATPADGKLNLNLTMSKNVNGIVAKITGTGYLADFEFVNDMSIGSSPSSAVSALKQAAGQFKNINGAMDFTWEIGKNTPGPGGEAQMIKLPGAISVSLAPLLEGLPITLEVSAAIAPHPMLTSGNQYSKGSFHVTYDGYQRFKFNDGNLDADGPMTGEPTADVPRNLSAVAPFGVVIGFAAPRIDLVFGGAGMISSDEIKKGAEWADKLIDAAGKRLLTPASYQTYKDSGFSMSGAATAFEHTNATLSLRVIASSTMTEGGASQITPCSKSTVDLSVYVGASAQALGLSAGSTSKRVMDKTFVHIQPPGTQLCTNL